MQYSNDGNDVWGKKVAICFRGVHDEATAQAQFLIHCYNAFRKLPVHAEQTSITVHEVS